MSLRVNVSGGTGGGRKKPPLDVGKEWRCRCRDGSRRRVRPGYLRNCPDCKEKRP